MLRISQLTVCNGIVVEATNSRTRMPELAAIWTALEVGRSQGVQGKGRDHRATDGPLVAGDE